MSYSTAVTKTISYRTFYDSIRPGSILYELPILLTFNILMVASAYVTVPLPFSPVPITGQTFGVLLVAMALGRLRGSAVVAAYLAEGAAGLPVFAGGSAGAHILIGPTGGYLIGFLPASYVVGWFAEHGWDRTLGRSIVAMSIGYLLIFGSGLSMLATFVPRNMVLSAGLYPFLPGTLVKIGLAGWILPLVRRFLR